MTTQPKHMRNAAGKKDAACGAAVVRQDSAEAKTAQVGRSAALMSVLVIVSRLTGFFRTWGQAYAIGVTVMASCYSIANNLPNQLYELVVAGMLTTAFLPVYMSVREKAGTKGASEYTSNLVSIVLVLMGAVTLLGFVFAAQLVYTQSFSAASDFDFDLSVYFFRFFVIEVVLYALSSIFSGVLNAERDYFWSFRGPHLQQLRDHGLLLCLRLPGRLQPPAGPRAACPGQPAGRPGPGGLPDAVDVPSRHSPALPHRPARPAPQGDAQDRRAVRHRDGVLLRDHLGAVLRLALRGGHRRLHHLLRAPLVHPALRHPHGAHYHGHVHGASPTAGPRRTASPSCAASPPA